MTRAGAGRNATRASTCFGFLLVMGPLLAAASYAASGPGAPAATRGPGPDDLEVERFLRQAEIVSIEDIGSGVTRPRKVVLERDGQRRKAAFKSLDLHQRGVTEFQDGSKVAEFTDSYAYERAAYLMDRRLGLGMVPVTVLRRIDGEEGALVDWVPGTVNEAERRIRDKATPERLRRQQDLMRVFDALLANTDRHAGNQLIGPDDDLHLIDHSRTFRNQRKLDETFLRLPVRITPSMRAELESLEFDDLRQLLHGLVSRVQIKMMLRRRDAILEKIRADIDEYGESYVLMDSIEVGDSGRGADPAASGGADERPARSERARRHLRG